MNFNVQNIIKKYKFKRMSDLKHENALVNLQREDETDVSCNRLRIDEDQRNCRNVMVVLSEKA